MTEFTMHKRESAPEEAKVLLDGSVKAFGMIPNLHAVMAESPELLEGYQTLHRLFQVTSLGTVEQNVVWMTINVEHRCHYCVPAHTFIAQKQGVDAATVQALRDEQPLPDARLEALRQFTLHLVRERGQAQPDQLQAFLAAGFTQRHVLDIVLGLAQKVMSNYVNHLADTPVDAPFARYSWEPRAGSTV